MKNLIFVCCLLLVTSIFAQSADDVTQEEKKLKQALSYGDKVIAAASMYNIIAIQGPQSTYKDSLAYLYFNDRNYVSCFLVTNDVLKTRPNDIGLLEMNAVSLESMGALEKGSEVYQKLLTNTNNNYYAYKLAGLQLALKKNDEAYVTVKKADQLPDTGKIEVTFQVNKNFNQKVSLKAAIAYLEGIIALNLKKESEAKLSFERAVTLFPDFVLAKSKLTTLAAKEEK